MEKPITFSSYDVLVRAHPELLAELGENEIKRRIAERNARDGEALRMLFQRLK